MTEKEKQRKKTRDLKRKITMEKIIKLKKKELADFVKVIESKFVPLHTDMEPPTVQDIKRRREIYANIAFDKKLMKKIK